MVENAGSIVVSSIGKQETYQINGTCQTIGDALDKFYGEEGVPEGTHLQIGPNEYDPEDDTALATALRGGDILMLLTKEIASGGVKGA